jgi:deazaflavin-dependent oxidoreductase (nitroreductase family)
MVSDPDGHRRRHPAGLGTTASRREGHAFLADERALRCNVTLRSVCRAAKDFRLWALGPGRGVVGVSAGVRDPAAEVNPVSAPDTSTGVAPERRRVLGLRRKPGRLALALFRMPLRAYRHDAGWVLGHTFMEFTHLGRNTGQPHETVAMVLRYDEGTREAVICAAWGPETDWFRNLRAGPATEVRLGRDLYLPQQRFLTADAALDVAVSFRRDHPHRLHLLQSLLGWGDLGDDAALRQFVVAHPMVAFRPKPAS